MFAINDFYWVPTIVKVYVCTCVCTHTCILGYESIENIANELYCQTGTPKHSSFEMYWLGQLRNPLVMRQDAVSEWYLTSYFVRS